MPKWYMICRFFDGFFEDDAMLNNRLTKIPPKGGDDFMYIYTYDEAGYPLTCNKVEIESEYNTVIVFSYIVK